MSDLNQINTALEHLFHKEGHRIVFWNDPHSVGKRKAGLWFPGPDSTNVADAEDDLERPINDAIPRPQRMS